MEGRFIGIDGGGSRLRAVAIDAESTVLAEAMTDRPANWATAQRAGLVAAMAGLLEGFPRVEAAVVAMAGASNEAICREAAMVFSAVVPAKHIRVVPDYHAVCAAAPGSDVCVIAGTGSVVCSEVAGKVVKSGGGGLLFGDEGSLAAIGRRAVRAFAREGKGRKAITAHFGHDDPDAMIAATYSAPSPAEVLVPLAIAILSEEGDADACAWLDEELLLLAALAKRHVDAYHSSGQKIRAALAGGLWDAIPRAIGRFSTFWPEAEMQRPSGTSVLGAAKLAQRLTL